MHSCSLQQSAHYSTKRSTGQSDQHAPSLWFNSKSPVAVERFGIGFVMAERHVVAGIGEDSCWNLSELPIFSYQLKFLGWVGWCIQFNMVSERDVLSSNPGGLKLNKNNLSWLLFPYLKPKGACTWGGVLKYKWNCPPFLINLSFWVELVVHATQ